MPTSPPPRLPAFVNPFDRPRGEGEKIPSPSRTSAPYSPLLVDATVARTTTEPSPPSPSKWRTRAASIFQSISSDKSSSSDRSDRGGAIPLKSDLNRDRNPSVAARRPSYVPKYAARAHMASMSGRSTMIGSEQEAEEHLRRGSRAASIAFGAGESLTMRAGPSAMAAGGIGETISE